MCGIFGIVADRNKFDPALVAKALSSISHRGPDSFGLVAKELPHGRVCWLGHRRLSILDLSQAGAQPMHRKFGSHEYSIVFNGEIYNHLKLRQSIKSQWEVQSRSDTEVLLAGLAIQGEAFISQLNAMMAFAFLDLNKLRLLLARDRLGKKPLYIYQAHGIFAFASELKPFQALDLPLTIDDEALAYYQWLGYVPAEMTIYKECKKFPASSFASLNLAEPELQALKPQIYWDPLASYGRSYRGSYEAAKEEFKYLLNDATKLRLDADVPVGVFLSGGIDSSLVASSIAALQHKEVQAFTVRFKDPAFDESAVAVETARQLGIKLNLLDLEASDFDRQMSLIPYHYDEPFSDSSQIPTLAVSEATKRHATVVLTGDGGDEVFLGYPRYSNQARLMSTLRMIQSIPGLSPSMLAFFASQLGQKLFVKLLTLSGMAGGQTNLDSKLARLRALLAAPNNSYIYEGVMCVQQKEWIPKHLQEILGTQSLSATIRSWHPHFSWGSLKERSKEEQLAALDLVSYLRDDVLVKVDRATMAYGLEARSPLLDYRIVEFGNSLPLDFKLMRGVHKRILRDVLAERLKGTIVQLGKKGFGVPLPETLPAGPTLTARWNRHVETQWRLSQGLGA